MIDIEKTNQALQSKGLTTASSTGGWYSQLDRNKGSVTPDTPAPLTLKQKMQAIMDKQNKTIQDSANLYKSGQQGIVETIGQTLGASTKAAGESFALPVNEALGYVGKAITKGREIQKENDQAQIDAGTLKPEDALSNKPKIEDMLAELVSKGASTEEAQQIKAHYEALSPRAKANIKGVTDLVSGIADLSIGAGAIAPVADAGVGALKTGEKVLAATSEKIAQKTAEKEVAKAFDAITPKTADLTPTEYEGLLNKGKITPKGVKTPSTYILSDEEKATALKYKDILQSKDPVVNSTNVRNAIIQKDADVGNFLRANNGIYNNGELKNYLTEKLAPLTDLTVDEKRLAKLKADTINNFVKGLPKNDMESLWKARKEFDSKIDKAFAGSPTLQNEIKIEFRNGIQNFIADRTPDSVYKSTMKEMSDLYKIRDNINTKAIKEKGKDGFTLWVKNHPTEAKALGIVGTLVAGKTAYSFLTD